MPSRTHVRRPGEPFRSRIPGIPAVIGAVALAVFAVPWSAEAQISARPVTLEIPSAPGAERVFTVKNEGAAPREIHIYSGDFDRTETGSFEFLPAGEHPRSCSPRMQIQPEGFSLAPGEERDVRVTLDSGERFCWSVVFTEVRGVSRSGLSVNQRIGIKVFGAGAGGERSGRVASVDVRDQDDGRAVRFGFENTGSERVKVRGSVEIRSTRGQVVRALSVAPFSVLPGRRRSLELAVPGDLDPGTYLAIPILEYGADALAGGQATFRVPRSSDRGAMSVEESGR